jgi:hypothetical protein
MSDDISINTLLRYYYPILYLIPLNFFIISGGMGSGIQWLFFKYQTTFMGDSVISITTSLNYVLSGTITGKSALYEISPLISVVILFIAFVYVRSNQTKISGVLTVLSGVISLSASVLQYGITLHGASGIYIPFGSVIFLVYGALLFLSVPDASGGNLVMISDYIFSVLGIVNGKLKKISEKIIIIPDYIFSRLGVKDNNLKNLVIIVIFFKLTIFLVIISAYFLLPFNVANYHSNFVYPPGENANVFSMFKTWDGQHYLYVAENGYPSGVSEHAAFYPLYPFLIKLVGFFLSGNTLLAGLIISNLCSILAIVYFYLLVKKLHNENIAFIASLFMISFITFFFTSLVYTEAIFLFLVIGFFYYFYEKKFYPCLLMCILIPLTRPTGILVILPLFTYLVWDIWESKRIREIKNYIMFIGFITGFLIYLCVMKYFTGAFFSGFDAQNLYVANNSISYLFDPFSWVYRNFITIHYTFNGFTTSLLNRMLFGFYLIILYYIYKYLDTTLFVYSLALGLIPALTGTFFGYSRYLLVIFPIFIVLSLKFQKKPYLIIIPLVLVQSLLLISHTLNYWVA